MLLLNFEHYAYGKLLRCPLLYGSVIHHLVQWCRIAVKSSFVVLYIILLWNCPSTCNGCERPVRFFLYTMPLFSGCNADCFFFFSFFFIFQLYLKKKINNFKWFSNRWPSLDFGYIIYIYIYIQDVCFEQLYLHVVTNLTIKIIFSYAGTKWKRLIKKCPICSYTIKIYVCSIQKAERVGGGLKVTQVCVLLFTLKMFNKWLLSVVKTSCVWLFGTKL